MAKEKKQVVKKDGEAKFVLRIEDELMLRAKKKAINTDRSLNGHIVSLIKHDLDVNILFKERTFKQSEIERLQSEVHEITGNGQVMACFNKLLGVCAGS